MAEKQPPADGRIARFADRATALHDYVLSLPKDQIEGNAQAVIDAINHFASTKGLPLIFGQNKLDVARGVLDKMEPKPKVIVEFGTFVGNSALAWGVALRDYHGKGAAGVHVYTFELEPQMAKIAQDLIRLAGLDDVITVLVGAGSESLKTLHAEGKVVAGGANVVFLDHWKDVYLPDLQLVEQLNLFRLGSVVIADNTDFPGAPVYVEYVQKGGSGASGSFRYETESLEAAASGRGPRIVMVSTVV